MACDLDGASPIVARIKTMLLEKDIGSANTENKDIELDAKALEELWEYFKIENNQA